MAERRMFAKTIVNSDAFMSMPLSAQALYFHLGMEADDDGFVANPTAIQRMLGAAPDDINMLFAKRFILGFESGVIVIKHWNMNNYIQKDRYKPTTYIEEKSTLTLDKKNAYTEADKSSMYTKCIQNVYKMYTQDSIDKVSIDYNTLSNTHARTCACTHEGKKGYGRFENVFLSDKEYESLIDTYGKSAENEIERLSLHIEKTGKEYNSCYAAVIDWVTTDKNGKKKKTDTNSYAGYDLSAVKEILNSEVKK